MNVLFLVFLYILYGSIVASMLIALLMIVKTLLANRISARFFHIIWLLIFLRLLMPVQLQTPFSISNLIPDHMQMLASYQDSQALIDLSASTAFLLTDDNSPASQAADTPAPGGLFNLQFILWVLAYIWVIGCGILIVSSLVFTLRFRNKLTASQRILDGDILELAKQCCLVLHIKRTIPLYMNPLIKSPGILGVIHPAIYLPEDIQTQVNPKQLQHIILHELAHYKRGDPLCNLFSLLAAAIHWFNPLVWLAVKEMRQDREVACDTYVMEVLGEPQAITYGMTILNLSRSFSRIHRRATLISFNETNGQVERRIKMIKKFKTGSYKLSALAIISCLVVGAVILTDAVSKKPSLNTMANVMSNEKISDKLVLIDPGHGGDDLGGTYPVDASDPSRIEVKEKDLNLDISLKLYEMLKKSGIKAEITRIDDRALTLDDRINMANADNAVLVLSIHNNMSNKATPNGTSTSFYAAKEQQNPVLTNARFAELLQTELVKQLQTYDLGSKEANFRILKDTKALSVQVDVAYLSNEQDRNNLMDETFRDKAAQALYDGVIASLNEMASAD
ncbi:MAG: M56/M15 family metallopeptidase [Syntrophomonadaceae bacterium]|nr:M56/M15 family metallopeptidase [Syntrophomonadaceae bacterium]